MKKATTLRHEIILFAALKKYVEEGVARGAHA